MDHKFVLNKICSNCSDMVVKDVAVDMGTTLNHHQKHLTLPQNQHVTIPRQQSETPTEFDSVFQISIY